MGQKQRIQKTLLRQLRDLDDHLFLLRESLHGLRQESAYLKSLSAELRVLVCSSFRTEGLLWRLLDKLNVSDSLHLSVPGELDKDHPLARGMIIAFVPLLRGRDAPPGVVADYYPLRRIIKDTEPVYVKLKGLTHEYLIKAVAQQMGSAHEDEGVEPSLATLSELFIGGVEPYVRILAFDAELVLQVGERVLLRAESVHRFKRKQRTAGEGDVTLVVRMGLRETLGARIPVFTFRSDIAESEVTGLAGPQSFVFTVQKSGCQVADIVVPYPEKWELNQDAVFAFSYSSAVRQARAISSDLFRAEPVSCDLGSVDAREIGKPSLDPIGEGFVYIQLLMSYARLLSARDCRELCDLSPSDFGGDWSSAEAPRGAGPFPD